MKIALALELAAQLATQFIQVSAAIQAAQAAGGDSISDEDAAQIKSDRDAAFRKLELAVAKAKAEGR